jgi:hypothetical protein
MWEQVWEQKYKYRQIFIKNNNLKEEYGGGSGIRTLGTLSRPSVFKTGAFDHSAKPPQWGLPKSVEMILQLGKIHSFWWGNLPIRAGLSCRAGLERVRVFQMLRKRGEGVCHENMVREQARTRDYGQSEQKHQQGA